MPYCCLPSYFSILYLCIWFLFSKSVALGFTELCLANFQTVSNLSVTLNYYSCLQIACNPSWFGINWRCYKSIIQVANKNKNSLDPGPAGPCLRCTSCLTANHWRRLSFSTNYTWSLYRCMAKSKSCFFSWLVFSKALWKSKYTLLLLLPHIHYTNYPAQKRN